MGLSNVDTQTGGITSYNDVTLVLDTSAYADGDLLSDVVEIPEAVRIEVGTGILKSIVVLDKDDQGAALDIAITRSSTSWGTINDAFSISDAIADDILWWWEFGAGDYFDGLAWQRIQKDDIGMPVAAETGSDSLYIAAVSRGTGTYTVSGITVKVGILAD